MKGNDLLDGRKLQPENERAARFRHSQPEDYSHNPDAVPRGRGGHIGDGVWLQRCGQCDDYALSYGSLPYSNYVRGHERTVHGTLPVALLPR